ILGRSLLSPSLLRRTLRFVAGRVRRVGALTPLLLRLGALRLPGLRGIVRVGAGIGLLARLRLSGIGRLGRRLRRIGLRLALGAGATRLPVVAGLRGLRAVRLGLIVRRAIVRCVGWRRSGLTRAVLAVAGRARIGRIGLGRRLIRGRLRGVGRVGLGGRLG